MTHPLHEDLARLLGERVRARSVVVWYDPRSEFVPFVDELRGAAPVRGEAATIQVGGRPAPLVQFDGSMFELRAQIEPLVSGDTPERVVIYLPGKAPSDGSVLKEAEKAGEVWEPGLKRLARNTLSKRYSAGVIDDLLRPDTVTYQDLVVAAMGGGEEPPSLLKTIFSEVRGTDAMLCAWLVADERDAQIEGKLATGELFKLIRSRLGLELPDDTTLAKARSATLRYVLGGEFRLDLKGVAPASLSGVPSPRTRQDEEGIRDLAEQLRSGFPFGYEAIADRVEAELSLSPDVVSPDALGSIDTFRFEERLVLRHCGELIAGRRFDEALAYVAQREQNFWLDRDVGRRAQWAACRLMADLGRIVQDVVEQVKATSGDV